MDYNQSINLLKLKNACIIPLQGKIEVKRGIFIPLQDNDIYESLDDNLHVKGVHLNLSVWELKEKGQYGDTHLVKQSFSKDYRDANQEAIANAPILGNMKPLERVNREPVSNMPPVSVDNVDLPF